MADYNPVASGLAQLGGQVANIFQNMAIQNEYKNSLPIMQDAFRKSLADFDAGRSAAGYARIMDVAMQNPNNPFIQNMAQNAFKIGQAASDDYMARQRMMRTGGGGAVGYTPEEQEEFERFGEPPAEMVEPPLPGEDLDETYVPQQGEKIVETPWLEEFGITSAVGPKKYQVPGRSMRMGSEGKSIPAQTINENEEREFDQMVFDGSKNFAALSRNPKLRKVWEGSGKDFGNISLTEQRTGAGMSDIYTASVATPQGPIEEKLTEGEYKTLAFFTDEAPALIQKLNVRAVRGGKASQSAPKSPKDLVAAAKQELGPQATKEQILARARELANQ